MTFILCLSGVTAAQSSQTKATVPPPSYHNLRYEESWSFLRQSEDEDLWQALKLISLNDEGSVFVSFGGQMRGRSEFWSDFAFNDGESLEDTFGLLRTRLHADLHLGSKLRLFVEGKSALTTGRELPGGPRLLDADSAALQNVFFDLPVPLQDDASLTFRVGRQELQFGRQRLVSPLDWSNTRPRMFDGFRGVAQVKSWRIDGFWSRFVRLQKYSFNNHDSGRDFFGVYASGPLPQTPWTLDLYWLGLDQDVSASLPTGQERHTMGGRLSGSLLADRPWDFDLEAAYQFGDRGAEDISAFMLASQLGYTFSRSKLRPRAYLGFDFATGDEDPEDSDAGTFAQLFPLGHAYLGFIDVVARQNILDFSQGLALQPVRRMRVALDGHFFWRAQEEDALYNAGGAVVRAGAAGTSRRVGSELDLTWRYGFDRHTLVVVGFSHFFAGKFIEETGSDRDIDFSYISLQYTF